MRSVTLARMKVFWTAEDPRTVGSYKKYSRFSDKIKKQTK